MAKSKKQSRKSSSKKGLKPWKKLGFFGKVWRFLWVAFLILWGFSIFQILFCAVFNPPITPLMVQRFVQQVKDPDRPVQFKRDYVSIDEISPNLVNAVVVAEDGLFMYHHGFDVPQLKQAYKENKQGRRIRGGSTISMQTAKNCFLPHKRTMLRKAVEAYYTAMMELVWSKKRIMECYLNIIEYGNGIYGCEAASQYYFHHSAQELTKHEAALLAASLPAPLKRNSAHPSSYHRRYASTIQGRMAKYGRINLDAKREDLNQKYVRQMDEGILDFAYWLLTDGKELKHKDKPAKSSAHASSHSHKKAKAVEAEAEVEEEMEEEVEEFDMEMAIAPEPDMEEPESEF